MYSKVEGSLALSGDSFQAPVALLTGSQPSLMNGLPPGTGSHVAGDK